MVQYGDNLYVLVCVFVMVQYGNNLEATVRNGVCVLVCVFVIVQYGDNLEATALVCVHMYVYL